MKILQLQNDLERLDREWESTRQSLLIQGQDGGRSEPSWGGAVGVGIVTMLGGVVFAMFAGGNGFPSFFPLFGVGLALIGFIRMVMGCSKASDFREESERYLILREQLVRRIEQKRMGT
ncbi:MAG: hypothetical protein QM755_23380 [Luteolibacter sp.]